jgi:predicted nuclease with RNAse H fold
MKSVVICGSNRFAPEMREFAKKLKALGVMVYEAHLYRASGGVWEEIKEFDKKFVALGLTHDHFYKMRMADVIYVYNKEGYAGVSVNMEIGYAAALNKPIFVFEEKDEELCRKVLFSRVAKTPAELVEYLK